MLKNEPARGLFISLALNEFISINYHNTRNHVCKNKPSMSTNVDIDFNPRTDHNFLFLLIMFLLEGFIHCVHFMESILYTDDASHCRSMPINVRTRIHAYNVSLVRNKSMELAISFRFHADYHNVIQSVPASVFKYTGSHHQPYNHADTC